jgi:pimeloyl-ACP methyl ester carboxylesterase
MDMTWEDRKQIARVYDTRESISAALDNVLTAKRLPDDLREQVIADSLRGAPQAKSAWPMIVMSEDIVSEVAKISVPVLVLAGELDQVDRVDSLQRDVVARIPGTRLHVLLGTGHLSPLEVPLAVAQNIQEFVSGLNHQQRNL